MDDVLAGGGHGGLHRLGCLRRSEDRNRAAEGRGPRRRGGVQGNSVCRRPGGRSAMARTRARQGVDGRAPSCRIRGGLRAEAVSRRRGAVGRYASEDCLYANVWVPEGSGRKKLPVMVWIY